MEFMKLRKRDEEEKERERRVSVQQEKAHVNMGPWWAPPMSAPALSAYPFESVVGPRMNPIGARVHVRIFL